MGKQNMTPLSLPIMDIYGMEYYFTLKRMEILSRAIIQMNLWDITLSEIAKYWLFQNTQRQVLYDSTCYMKYLRVVKFTETEGRRVVARGWGKGERGAEDGYTVSVLQDKEFWRWVVVLVARNGDYTSHD